MGSSYKRIAAVKTSMDILEYLSNQTRMVTGKEISEALNLPYGTVMSHIATLADGGYVSAVGDGLKVGTRMSLFWLRLKAEAEGRRTTIEQALGLLGGM